MAGLVDALTLGFWRVAASGALPAGWFASAPPAVEDRAARRGRLHVEIVSHCWRYQHLLVHQLASLVRHPPHSVEVTMTVFFAEEDTPTVDLLDRVSDARVDGVHWNLRALPPVHLFRRAIGRNLAALASRADWIWFTDCDLLFAEGCLDALGGCLQGRRDALVYPRVERVTALLDRADARLRDGIGWPPPALDLTDSRERCIDRATGPLQITHGDVARAMGYCRDIRRYQKPEPHFAKCHEDRAFRWLLRTAGVPIDLPGVYRLRHAEKGRYRGGGVARFRLGLRRWQDRRSREDSMS